MDAICLPNFLVIGVEKGGTTWMHAQLKKHPETHSLGISFEEEVALIEKKLEETN